MLANHIFFTPRLINISVARYDTPQDVETQYRIMGDFLFSCSSSDYFRENKELNLKKNKESVPN